MAASRACAADAERAVPAAGLPAVIGWPGVALYTFGLTVGSGIFRVPADVARYSGSTAAMLALWVGGVLVATASILFFLELAVRDPRSGGKVVYLREAFGPGTAFVYGVAGALFLPAAVAAVARTFADYLGSVVPMSEGALRLVAASLVAVHTVIGMRSTRAFARLLTGAAVVKIAALSFVLLLSFAQVAPAHANAPPVASVRAAWLLGFIPVVWAFAGIEAATNVAGEVRRPGRDLALGMLIGVAAVGGFYVALSLGFVRVLGFGVVAHSAAVASAVMGRLLGRSGALAIAALVMASTFVTNGAQILGFSRQFYALAQDGLFFAPFARLHARWRTPWRAVLLVGGAAIALSLAGGFEVLIRLFFIAIYPFFVLSAFAPLVLRRRHGIPSGFRMPLYPLPVVVFVAVIVPVWFAGVRDSPRLAALAAGVLALGAAAYLRVRAGSRRTARPLDRVS